MSETTPLIKAALNLRVGVGFDVYEKPFDESKMKNVMEECLQFYDVQQANKTLFFRKDGIILALDREEILYSESIQHIMYIHTTKEDTLSIPQLRSGTKAE